MAFESLLEAYWPLLQSEAAEDKTSPHSLRLAALPEPGLVSKAVLFVLRQLKVQTDPLKQTLIYYEEVPQFLVPAPVPWAARAVFTCSARMVPQHILLKRGSQQEFDRHS